MEIIIWENEYWWGGSVNDGNKLPYSHETVMESDLSSLDQSAAIFMSSKGRYIFSKKPFLIKFCNGIITVTSKHEVELSEGHKTLKGAHIAAARKYFDLSGKIPDQLFFSVPQYNTWIELMYNQNQDQILEYAQSIIDNGLPPGILMIDEGWSEDYGIFEFYPGRFHDPKVMVKKLHQMGFKVMLWVTPHISPDSNAFRELKKADYLIKDKNNDWAIREWWNGFSCVLDLTNPNAQTWLKDKLDACAVKYGVDGYKFDAGDSFFYRSDDKTYIEQLPQENTKSYNDFALQYEFNELRAAWNVLGSPLICRLQDKYHRWEDSGLDTIIPNMLAQGITGVYYGCPDMIGGGAFSSFLNDFIADEELYLRWIEASAFCPMMQFSIAPWRVLKKDTLKKVKEYAELHHKYGDYIIELAKYASLNGEPIVRYMEYEFPEQGFEKIKDQYMLGNKILVAPVIRKGEIVKTVRLPFGRWRYFDGEEYDGGVVMNISAPREILPYFFKVE